MLFMYKEIWNNVINNYRNTLGDLLDPEPSACGVDEQVVSSL